jgi:hypothetical protein
MDEFLSQFLYFQNCLYKVGHFRMDCLSFQSYSQFSLNRFPNGRSNTSGAWTLNRGLLAIGTLRTRRKERFSQHLHLHAHRPSGSVLGSTGVTYAWRNHKRQVALALRLDQGRSCDLPITKDY